MAEVADAPAAFGGAAAEPIHSHQPPMQRAASRRTAGGGVTGADGSRANSRVNRSSGGGFAAQSDGGGGPRAGGASISTDTRLVKDRRRAGLACLRCLAARLDERAHVLLFLCRAEKNVGTAPTNVLCVWTP